MRKSKAILTFDLEFWYNSKFLKKYLPEDKKQLEDYTKKTIMLLLDLLKKYNQRVTFFVLGQLAEKYSNLIKKISDLKHEIASHGYSHKTLWELDEKSFEGEIKLSKEIIKNIISKEPKGFRAPNFSLNKKTKWALEVLKKHNFSYDSSIHPLKPYYAQKTIKEIYPSLGGIYFRILPLGLYLLLVKILSKTKIPVLYFHPYELFESSPRLKSAPWHKRKIKYWGTKNAWKKFEKLMKKFEFISIEQYLNENPFN
jgi:peptidoglycan/xylan/chitin deacetylase (PgdA/CDA1 family)